jgi:bifunctional oligoribonuclease and PAP phosphatase NrnA
MTTGRADGKRGLRPSAARQADWARAVSLIGQAGEIGLACHIRPDGDALGSMLAVAHALRALPTAQPGGTRPGAARPGGSRSGASRTRVVASFGDQPFAVPAILRFLPGLDLLSPPGSFPAAPELMITFDVASVDRLGVLAASAVRARELIVLDHHASNPGFGTVNLIDPAAAATAVLAGKLIDRLGVEITGPIAAGIYTGLATDTGSFRFNATPQLHRLAARLLETGIDPGAIAHELWDCAPFSSLRVLSAALGRAVLEPDQAGGHGLVWTTVTRHDRAVSGLPFEVAESVIDVVRRTAEAEVALVFKESDEGDWHVSARSNGQVDVGRACIELGGGGHDVAAGFTTHEPVADTMARLRELLVPIRGADGQARPAAALAAEDGGR